MEAIEKGIFLTFDEIKILLFNMKVSAIEGIYMPEKVFQKEGILLAMHHMTAAGIIAAEKERFRIREDVKRMLEIMAFPEETEVWSPYDREGPTFFFYQKEKWTVVSELFFGKKDTLKLTLFEKTGFEKWRKEFADDYHRD